MWCPWGVAGVQGVLAERPLVSGLWVTLRPLGCVPRLWAVERLVAVVRCVFWLPLWGLQQGLPSGETEARWPRGKVLLGDSPVAVRWQRSTQRACSHWRWTPAGLNDIGMKEGGRPRQVSSSHVGAAGTAVPSPGGIGVRGWGLAGALQTRWGRPKSAGSASGGLGQCCACPQSLRGDQGWIGVVATRTDFVNLAKL